MRREIVAGLGIAALLAGCLFPSFDDLKGGASELDAGKRTSHGSSSSGAAGGDADVGPTSSSGAIANDAGKDAATPQKVIACGSLSCDATKEFCCDDVTDGASCKPNGSACDGAAWEIHCDESSDCNTGETCCKDDPFSLSIVCTKNCNGGPVICREGTICSGGNTCGRNFIGPPNATLKTCD